jgi:hypothetical protein
MLYTHTEAFSFVRPESGARDDMGCALRRSVYSVRVRLLHGQSISMAGSGSSDLTSCFRRVDMLMPWISQPPHNQYMRNSIVFNC